jgi:uncharacterized protein YbjT (DUF2867 family)
VTILVTGVTGLVGGLVAESLVARGVGVRALARDRERGRVALLGLSVEIVIADFDQPETVADAVAGCEGMFLVSSDSDRQVAEEITAARSAVEAGVEHIVKLSSSDAGQRPYKWSTAHAEIEKAIGRMDVGHSFLRPHFFMQNFFSLLKTDSGSATDQNALVTIEAPAATGTIGAIDAYDIGECAAELLANGTPLGNHALLTGPENISMSRVAEAFGIAIDRNIAYTALDPADYRARLEADDPETAGDIADVYEEVRVDTMAVQSEQVEQITGNPPRSIEKFATANVAAINAAIADASAGRDTT